MDDRLPSSCSPGLAWRWQTPDGLGYLGSRQNTMSASKETSSNLTYRREVASGERFAFGRNWQQFLRIIDDTRIQHARDSLSRMLREPTLAGRFLDIGCGSGLFSLAARQLGARVHSFDFDAESVACAVELRRRYFRGDMEWTIEQGSVLDEGYMASLGTFDVVYSWGVLHHTGRMWDGIDAACRRVEAGGKLFIALYNDLGSRSARWRAIKRMYNQLPGPMRPVFTGLVMTPGETKALVRATLNGRPASYLKLWSAYNDRGMNRWRDMVDWVGGYPYEVATPEQVFDFCRERGFSLFNLKCGGVGLGCNEFVFERGLVREQA
jgi:2-polyprenyl-6-hydroxyphenyl methylase/3-demethylubiquinone-9 3-methyltransferase